MSVFFRLNQALKKRREAGRSDPLGQIGEAVKRAVHTKAPSGSPITQAVGRPSRPATPGLQAGRTPLQTFSDQLTTDLGDKFAGREADLAEQFAQARIAARSRFAEGERQLGRGLDRLRAISGRSGGESFGKALETGRAELARQQAGTEAEISAQEAAARSALGAERTQLEQQAEQFKAQMQFQEGSFAQQMGFQWAEFDENLKTNWINAVVALKDAGLKSEEDWGKVLGAIGVLGRSEGVNVSGAFRGRSAFEARRTPDALLRSGARQPTREEFTRGFA